MMDDRDDFNLDYGTEQPDPDWDAFVAYCDDPQHLRLPVFVLGRPTRTRWWASFTDALTDVETAAEMGQLAELTVEYPDGRCRFCVRWFEQPADAPHPEHGGVTL